MSRDRNDRYIIKYGKYGAYFYDNDSFEAMSLEKVCGMLNHLERRRIKHETKKEN